MKAICVFSPFFVYLRIYGFSSSPRAPHDLEDITLIKEKCHIQEVNKKLNHYEMRFLALQWESDILNVDRLERIGLVG